MFDSRTLIHHLPYIAEHLNLTEVLSYFAADEHLTTYEHQSFIAKESTCYEHNVAFVYYLQRKNLCDEFLKALEKTGQKGLAETIKTERRPSLPHSATYPSSLAGAGRFDQQEDFIVQLSQPVDLDGNDKLLKLPAFFDKELILGACFDARKCQMFSVKECRLWRLETIKEHMTTQPCYLKREEKIEHDTLNEKLSKLNCASNEKLCILAGAFSLSGSGKYLTDYKKNDLVERVTFHYSIQSFFSMLGNNPNNKLPENDIQDFIARKKATHAIVAIKYGFDCYFVFDREKSDSKSYSESLQSIITRALSKDNSEEFELLEEITCQYYGDTLPGQLPNSLKQAKQMLQGLRSSTLHQVVPKTLYLFPLSELFEDNSLHVRKLSDVFLDSSEKQLQLFIDKRRQLTSMLKRSLSFGEWFQSEIENRILKLVQAETEFKSQLKQLVEQYRADVNFAENKLISFIKSWDNSILGKLALQKMCDDYKEEIEQINSIVKDLERHKVLLKTENDAYSFSKRGKLLIEVQLRFAFYRGSDNKMLEAFFKDPPVGTDATVQSKAKWFDDPDQMELIEETLDAFIAFVSVRENANKCDFVASFAEKDANDNPDFDVTKSCVEVVCKKFRAHTKVVFPRMIDIKINTTEATFITLSWNTDDEYYNHISEVIVYHNKKGENHKNIVTFKIDQKTKFEPLTITHLQPSTNYQIELQFTTQWGVMRSFDKAPLNVKTTAKDRRSLFDLKLDSEKADDTKWKKSVLVPKRFEVTEAKRVVNFATGEEGGVRKYIIGGQIKGIQRDKVILLVGGTGFGKTTLLNCMANYLYEVQQDDDFRFRLVSEDEELQDNPSRDETRSMTKWVTAYVLNNTILDYRLTIVDTPGFNDTTGVSRDREITNLIHEWFKEAGPGGLDRLDAVCLVVRGTESKLTEATRYVLNSAISLLGNNMVENIVLLLTFCDRSLPPALAAVKKAGINSTLHFKFNNSAFFEKENDAYQKELWCDAMESFANFFSSLSKLKPQSLQMSNDVLEDRVRIEENVKELEIKTKNALNYLALMEEDLQAINKHKKDIEENRDFTFTTMKEIFQKFPLNKGQYKAVNCISCQRTCHENCFRCNVKFPNLFCRAIKGACSVCPQKCHSKRHELESWVYKSQIVQVDETREDLKEKYGSAEESKNQTQVMLEKLASDMLNIQIEIQEHVEMIKHCMQQLEKNAMFPKHITEISYIQSLITYEKTSQAPNWKSRVGQLDYQLELAAKINDANNPEFNPLLQYKDNYMGALQFLADRYPNHQDWYKDIMPHTPRPKDEGKDTDVKHDQFIYPVSPFEASSPEKVNLVSFKKERVSESLRLFSAAFHDQIIRITVICQQLNSIKKNMISIDGNEHFIFFMFLLDRKKYQLPPGSHSTICTECQIICHHKCRIELNADKMWCSAMQLMAFPYPDQILDGSAVDGEGLLFYKPTAEQKSTQLRSGCTICPGRCHWSKHRGVEYAYELKKEKRLVTARQMALLCNMKIDENNFSALQLLKFLGTQFINEDKRLAQMVADTRQLIIDAGDTIMPNKVILEKFLAEARDNCTVGNTDRIDVIKRHIVAAKDENNYTKKIHISSEQFLALKFKLHL